MEKNETEPRSPWQRSNQATVAKRCLEAGIQAAHPRQVVHDEIAVTTRGLRVADEEYDLTEIERVIVVGGGNAAGEIAAALEEVFVDTALSGSVVTDGDATTAELATLPGDHPLPTAQCVESTRQMMAHAAEATEDDLVVAIVTGGGSSLIERPIGELEIDHIRRVTDGLLKSGAPITEINTVRKHLSTVKGGHLARNAHPAQTVGLLLSDVVGNDPSVIASGPTVPDNTTFGDALSILDRFGVSVPKIVEDHLVRGTAGLLPETPDTADPIWDTVSNHILADGQVAIDAAASVAADHGYQPLVLSSTMRGEAKELGSAHLAIAEEVEAHGNPVEPPAALLSGGEATVAVNGDGIGGPNQEFVVGCAAELDRDSIVVGSIDTDGYDGSTDTAGAIIDRQSIDRYESTEALTENNTYELLAEANAHLLTGATGTNVNDLRILLVSE